MKCPKCGVELPEGALLCPVCGAELAEAAEALKEKAEEAIEEKAEEAGAAVEETVEKAEEAIEEKAEEAGAAVEETIEKAEEAIEEKAEEAETVVEETVEKAEEAADGWVSAEKKVSVVEEPAAPKKLGAGAIAGIVIAALAVLCAVLFALSYYDIARVPLMSKLTDSIKGVTEAPEKNETPVEVPEGYDPSATVLTANGIDYDGAFFSLLYSNVYNQYAQEAYYMSMYGYSTAFDTLKDPAEQTTTNAAGETLTYHELFVEESIAALEQTAYYQRYALDKGLTLSEENAAELEEIVDSLKANAESEGKSLEAFLTDMFCPGVTEDTVRVYLEASMLAEQGKAAAGDDYAETLDPYALFDALESKRDYLTVDLRFCYLQKSGDDEADADAKARMEKILEEITDEETFTETVRKNLDEDAAARYTTDGSTLLPGMTYAYVSQNINEDLADWLFDETRAAGDKTLIESDSFLFVVRLTAPAAREDQPSVHVRHVLLTFASVADASEDDAAHPEFTAVEKLKASDGTEITNEGTSYAGWVVLETYEQAKKLYDDLLKDGVTEEEFAALAAEASEDTGSSDNGGLYEDVPRGQMVQPFNDWIFDSARKPGDTGLVKTSYGWHLMYFVGANDLPDWANSLLQAEADKHAAELQAEYTGKGVRTAALQTAADTVLATINRQISDYLAEQESEAAAAAETTTLATE
ncbi:MAG: peptidylprolyl isomerase [Clostridia bacterium]|nr:peptidylprolyl isomerase [Clostridia bacterium]MBR5410390.1 peptidylprolyl isomerase [Clostridia bacterium]